MRQPWLVGLLIAGIVLGSLALLLTLQKTSSANEVVERATTLTIDEGSARTSASEAEILSSLEDLSFQEFVDTSYRAHLHRVPQSITLRGMASLLDSRHDQLNSFAFEYLAETQRIEVAILKKLREYDRTELRQDQQLAYDVCEAFWSRLVAAQPYAGFDYLVTHSNSDSQDWLTYDLLTTYHPRSSLDDIEDYITRLSLIETQFDQLIQGLEDRAQRGVIAPKPVLTKALSLLAIMAYGPLETHPVFFNVALMVVANEDLSETLKRTIFADTAVLMNTSVIPAYRRLYAKIAELETIAPTTVGIQRIPDGASYYEYLVQAYGETDLSSRDIHEWAVRQISDCQREISDEASAIGYAYESNFSSLIHSIASNGGTTVSDNIPVAFGLQINRAHTLSQQAFESLPSTSVTLAVNPFNDIYYQAAALDGSREPVLSVPRTGEQPTYFIATRTFHETYPGLHVLIANQQNSEFPLLRQAESFAAHTLGWAAYAERLAWEIGAYANDPYGNIGRLVEELRQAVLVAVDTGIHSQDWEYDEALTYYLENTGDDALDAEMNVLQVIAHPGSSLPAFTGFRKILELRNRMQQAQEDVFDLAGFHALMVENGSLPLALLEALVDEVIDHAATE